MAVRVGVAKKARDLDGIDFVGVDERGQRLLSLEVPRHIEAGISDSGR